MALWIPKRLVEISLINTAAQNKQSFVSHCEIEYECRVAAAAREAIAGGYKIVMLTGPSSSGKTTTANKLAQALTNEGHKAVVISLDNFYKNIEDYPRLENGEKDYENVTALDIDLINKCLAQLVETGKTEIPIFDFVTEMRKKETIPISLEKGGIAVVEGIHALNPVLIEKLPQKAVYKVYAGMREEYSFRGQRILPTRDIRLARRMVRDAKFRGHKVEKTVNMWPKVCEGEDKYIKVFKPQADLLLDTSFSYEICALAPYVAEFKNALGTQGEDAVRLNDLCDAFSLCDIIEAEYVPQNSMLREFFG